MNRDSLAKSALLAWWALGKFAAKPYSTRSNFNLFSALSGLGLGAFRAVQGRLTEQSWIQREADPAGRWVERLRDELSTLTHQHTDPHQCWDREWDGQWRLLAFDIPAQPKARRQKLWRWLKQNRLGLLQRSLWVSTKPLNEIRELFHDTADSRTLLLWEAPTPKGLNPTSLVEQAWDMNGLDALYSKVLSLCREKPNPDTIRKATFSWQQAIQADPLLPRRLYPKSFRGFQATEQLKKMWAKLSVPKK